MKTGNLWSAVGIVLSVGIFPCAGYGAAAIEYGYHLNNFLKSVALPNGITTTYEIDALNRVTSVVHRSSSNTIISRFDYTYYADGQKQSVAEYDGTTIYWQYDNLDRLTTETYNAPGDSEDYVHIYQYDLAGNRVKKIVITPSDPQYPQNSVTSDDITYTYNALNQLQTETINGKVTTYTYNANGGLISKEKGTETTTYDYSLHDRLAAVSFPSGILVEYQYNPDGLRVGKTIDGATTQYLIDPQNPTGLPQVLQAKGADGSETFIPGKLVHAQAQSSGQIYWYLYDGHGSVRHLTNASGEIVESYHYDAFGNLLPRSFPFPTARLLYAGQWRDADTEFYDQRSRWYDPHTGRFVQPDKFSGFIKNPQSLHKYVYAHNNPVNLIDPTGRFSIPEVIGALSLIAFLPSFAIAPGDADDGDELRNRDPLAENAILGIATGGAIAAIGKFVITPLANKFVSRFFNRPQGLSRSSVVSPQRAEEFLVKTGIPEDVAPKLINSFEGEITARLYEPSQGPYWRYFGPQNSVKGNFVTTSKFSSPQEAVDALFLGPYNNPATLSQEVFSTGRTIVFEGAIQNSTQPNVIQILIVRIDDFFFGPGAPVQ